MSERVVHFVLHVPKCAGTTVEEHFRGPLHHGFLIAPRWEHVLRNFIGNRYRYPPDAPRLKPQYMETYETAFRERSLSLADVSLMDRELCRQEM